eukprot:2589581-Pyramimonas_sp.AAC.1
MVTAARRTKVRHLRPRVWETSRWSSSSRSPPGMRSLQEALDTFKNMRAHVAAQLAGTVAAVIRGESRRLKGLAKGGAAVHMEARTASQNAAATARQGRREFKEHMDMKREAER